MGSGADKQMVEMADDFFSKNVGRHPIFGASKKDIIALAQLLTSVRDQAYERAAGCADKQMNCGCGRADCYSDRIPEGIATDIRSLKSNTTEG